MIGIFSKLINKIKLEKRKKEVTVICDFMKFLEVGGLKCYAEQSLDDGNTYSIPIELSPEQIDKWLLMFYEILDKKNEN